MSTNQKRDPKKENEPVNNKQDVKIMKVIPPEPSGIFHHKKRQPLAPPPSPEVQVLPLEEDLSQKFLKDNFVEPENKDEIVDETEQFGTTQSVNQASSQGTTATTSSKATSEDSQPKQESEELIVEEIETEEPGSQT